MLLTLPMPVPGLDVPVMAAVGVAALGTGAAAWVLPWERWSQRATLLLMAPAFTLIALTDTFGANAAGPGGPQPYGVFLLVAFVWLGMAHPPLTSAALAPFAALACVLPGFSLQADARVRLHSAALIIPLCVLVGEGVAWAAARLDRTEPVPRRESRSGRLAGRAGAGGRLLTLVSHELRTPITVCRGYLEVLEDGAGEREVREVKDTLIGQLDLMARLVEDLTTLALADDAARLRLEALSPRRFADGVAKQAEPLLGARFRAEPGGPDGTLLADPQRLSQAVLNLLRNAAEHTEGTGPVWFRVRADSAGCRFEVADQGGGLPRGTEETVFEPFRTASPATGGTGLGLSIVRGVARAHGGEAGVDNRPGRGATFWIWVPR
ncbi:MAG: HAMP domain-containing histidine kinase [Streptosporangiales bacterium]|nr:HAMP domain-containing histidine kinase [Streptosporangiales bacterium]